MHGQKNIKLHTSCSVTFSPESLAVYEIIWKNVVGPERPQVTIRRMRFACWITGATDTRSEYGTLTAFPQQQYLLERVTLYVDGLSCSSSVYCHSDADPNTDQCSPLSLKAQWREETISGAFTSAVQSDHAPATHLLPCTALYYTLSLLSCPRRPTALTGWLDRWRLSVRYTRHVPGHITMDILYISVTHLDFRRRGVT